MRLKVHSSEMNRLSQAGRNEHKSCLEKMDSLGNEVRERETRFVSSLLV